MTLTINQQQIDFTLENEATLKEVVSNIDSWLSNDQLTIEKLVVNGSDYSDRDLDISLDSINSIEIETLSFHDMNVHNISWIKYFFEQLISAIESWNPEILEQVEKESAFILNNISTILSEDNKTPDTIITQQISELLSLYNNFQCSESIVDKDKTLGLLNRVIILLNERLNEFENVEAELQSGIEVLNSLTEELESVSIYLQSGKSREAATIMGKFTGAFNKVLRIINFNIKNPIFADNSNIQDFVDGLDEILHELLEGFESQDTVLIGDILEFELPPKIESLKQIFSKE